MKVPISTSARHIHLTREHVDALFGPGYQLTEKVRLSQPGQYACNETVTLTGPKNSIAHVRILGPERSESQVEVSKTDLFMLGIDAPVRISGDLSGTPGIRVTGPAGTLDLAQGVIQAKRHVHLSSGQAASFGVKDRDWVMIRIPGTRGLIFDNVVIRAGEGHLLDMHIDTDEANAAGTGKGTEGLLIREAMMMKPEPEL